MTNTERPRRPFSVQLLATPAKANGTDGLWEIYQGGVVDTCIPEVGGWNAIRLVVDLSSLRAASAEIPALREHYLPIGRWTEIVIADVIAARLNLLKSSPDTVGLCMFDAAREIGAALAQGFPWQASLGAYPDPERAGVYEQVVTATVVNGRTITPDGVPTFVLRNGLLEESSVVLFGADRRTGQVAASARTAAITNPNPGATVTDKNVSLRQRLDTLATRLGAAHRGRIATLMAEDKSDEEIAQTVNDDEKKALQTQVTELTTKLDAETKRATELEGKLQALAAPGDQGANGAAGEGKAAAGKAPTLTLTSAMLSAMRENPKLSPLEARRAALAKHPHLDPNRPADAAAKK